MPQYSELPFLPFVLVSFPVFAHGEIRPFICGRSRGSGVFRAIGVLFSDVHDAAFSVEGGVRILDVGRVVVGPDLLTFAVETDLGNVIADLTPLFKAPPAGVGAADLARLP